MNDKKQSMYESLKQAIENGELKLPEMNQFTSIMSAPTYRDLKEHIEMPPNKTGEIFGIDVVADESIPHGQVVLMQYRPTKRIIEFEPLPETIDAFHRSFEKRLNELIYGAFRVPPEYIRDEPLWKRLDGESLIKWSNRLFENGHFDDPDIRWEYQKSVYSAPFSFAIRIWHKIRR